MYKYRQHLHVQTACPVQAGYKRKHVSTFLPLLLLSFSLQAQIDSLPSHSVGLGYFSEGGFYPGFTFNYERNLLASQRFQLVLASKAGAYFHYRNHTGVFVMIQSGQRFRLHRNLFLEHFVGIGYLHSFLSGGDAYYVSATGKVERAHNTGNPHFMPSVSFGLSYGLKYNNYPTRIFGRPMVFWQIPFNRSSLVQFAFEAGALITLKK